MSDDRASIKERYTSAIGSTRLTLVAERTGDVDLLIAAGWVQDGLATQIYRLMAEFDTVRGEVRVAQQEQVRLQDELTKHRKRHDIGDHTSPRGPMQTTAHRREGEALSAAMEQEALQARAFALLQLKTLASTKQAVGRYADQQATRRGLVSLSPLAVMAIVGKVLEVMLDPLCAGCQGSGKVGTFPNQYLHTGKGASFCGGSGRRKVDLAHDAAGESFGRWLLSDLERKAEGVDQRMRQFLRRYQMEQPKLVAESEAAVSQLQRRLVELRSAEAAVD